MTPASVGSHARTWANRWSAIAMVIVVAGCAGQRVIEPAESESPNGDLVASHRASSVPTPSLMPSEPPSPRPTTAPTTLVADSVAQVVTTDLVQRSAPGTGSDSAIFPQLLNEPTYLYVVDGPTVASGLDWYLVVPFEVELDGVAQQGTGQLGWVAAAGPDGEAWIAPATIDCPEPTFASIIDLPAVARLACYGSSPVTFDTRLHGRFVAMPGLVEPSWISTVGYHVSMPGEPPPRLGSGLLTIHVDEDLGMELVDAGATIRLDGHFDHPAARSCRPLPPPAPAGQTPPPPGPLDDEVLILNCRTNFVATSVEVISP